jgi:hypothetical protein
MDHFLKFFLQLINFNFLIGASLGWCVPYLGIRSKFLSDQTLALVRFGVDCIVNVMVNLIDFLLELLILIQFLFVGLYLDL